MSLSHLCYFKENNTVHNTNQGQESAVSDITTHHSYHLEGELSCVSVPTSMQIMLREGLFSSNSQGRERVEQRRPQQVRPRAQVSNPPELRMRRGTQSGTGSKVHDDDTCSVTLDSHSHTHLSL